ncbi:MAG: Ribosomal small subunit methyltransferase [Planctomycetota bacterium]
MAKSRGNSSSNRFNPKSPQGQGDPSRAGKLRVIAGSHRGRTLLYRGNFATRPMKDRTREALFSRLGGYFDGEMVFDLFAGTGILALEALSRGAGRAIVVDILPAAAADIRTAANEFGWQNEVEVRCGDVFSQAKAIFNNRQPSPNETAATAPWLVFVCPPYSMWDEQKAELAELLQDTCDKAPSGSVFAVELEEHTPLDVLPASLHWDVRLYRPAQVAIAEKE